MFNIFYPKSSKCAVAVFTENTSDDKQNSLMMSRIEFFVKIE